MFASQAKSRGFDSHRPLQLLQPRGPHSVVESVVDAIICGVKSSTTLVTTVTTPPLYQDFITYKKASKGLTKSSEVWFGATILPFLNWLPKVHVQNITQVTSDTVVEFLGQFNHMPWRKHGYYRALRTFFKWISTTYKVPNPFIDQFGNPAIEPPKVPQKLLYTLEPDKIANLIQAAEGLRNKSLISLLADSGARRSELASIQVSDLDMAKCRIKVCGKGGKQGWLIFGPTTKQLLAVYIEEQSPSDSLFELNAYGVQSMLRRLGDKVGFNCSAHSFRRGFATELRKQGLSELDIAELGRWSSTAIAKRYSRAYTFEDAASRYKAIV